MYFSFLKLFDRAERRLRTRLSAEFLVGPKYVYIQTVLPWQVYTFWKRWKLYNHSCCYFQPTSWIFWPAKIWMTLKRIDRRSPNRPLFHCQPHRTKPSGTRTIKKRSGELHSKFDLPSLAQLLIFLLIVNLIFILILLLSPIDLHYSAFSSFPVRHDIVKTAQAGPCAGSLISPGPKSSLGIQTWPGSTKRAAGWSTQKKPTKYHEASQTSGGTWQIRKLIHHY